MLRSPFVLVRNLTPSHPSFAAEVTTLPQGTQHSGYSTVPSFPRALEAVRTILSATTSRASRLNGVFENHPACSCGPESNIKTTSNLLRPDSSHLRARST